MANSACGADKSTRYRELDGLTKDHPEATGSLMIRQRLWRPYTQMMTANPPLEAARSEGSTIHLADGRVLIDGIASWWTACHGYNHPHIREAVTRPARSDAARHVRGFYARAGPSGWLRD